MSNHEEFSIDTFRVTSAFHIARANSLQTKRAGLRKMLSGMLRIKPELESPPTRCDRAEARRKTATSPNQAGDYTVLVERSESAVWFQTHIPLSCLFVVVDAYFLPGLMDWIQVPFNRKIIREWPLFRTCVFLDGNGSVKVFTDHWRRRCNLCERLELDVVGAIDECHASGESQATLEQLRALEPRHLLLRDCPCGAAAYCSKACQKQDWSRHRSKHLFGVDDPSLAPRALPPLRTSWSHGIVRTEGKFFIVTSFIGAIADQLPERFADNLD